MVSSRLTILLTLSRLNSALNRSCKHFSFHHAPSSGMSHGTGLVGFPRPTGGFPMNGTEGSCFSNGTEAGFGVRSNSLPVLTATVLSVSQSSDVAVATKEVDEFSSPAVVHQTNVVSTPVADTAAPADSGADGSEDIYKTATITPVSVQHVTVTANAGVESEVASRPVDASVSTPAGFEAPDFGTTLLSDIPSVSAGAFYGGGHSFSNGGSASVPSAAAPTTMTTSYGAGWAASTSSAAPASSTAVFTTATTPSTSFTGSSQGKKGLSYNTASLLSVFDGAGMSWAYNWADTASGAMPSGVEYVPMCWGLESVPTCADQAKGASHVLSFNEPDLGAQSNMDPQTAAENHIKYLNPLSDSGSRIGSPAITNGASTSPLMGVNWLNEFFTACGGQCKVDFVAFHWYDSSAHFDSFESHVTDVIRAANSNNIDKVWLTEFGTTDGDSPDFIQQAISLLDNNSAVEKYAYFMVDNILEQGGALSAAGKAYAA